MQNGDETQLNNVEGEANPATGEAFSVSDGTEQPDVRQTESDGAADKEQPLASGSRKKWSKALDIALWALIALLIVAVVLRIFVFGKIVVSGKSMTAAYYSDESLPSYNAALTFFDGDSVNINKVRQPVRGDVAVFFKHDIDSKFKAMFARGDDAASGGKYEKLIKRVVALGGDKLWLEPQGNGLYRLAIFTAEGVTLHEDYYVKHGQKLSADAFLLSDSTASGLGCLRNATQANPYVVAEGCFFAMGDNRADSADSRGSLGDVPLSRMYGVVF